VHVYAYVCIDEILAEKRALFSDGVDAQMLRRLDLETLLGAVKAQR
jgi:hypothetical protein